MPWNVCYHIFFSFYYIFSPGRLYPFYNNNKRLGRFQISVSFTFLSGFIIQMILFVSHYFTSSNFFKAKCKASTRPSLDPLSRVQMKRMVWHEDKCLASSQFQALCQHPEWGNCWLGDISLFNGNRSGEITSFIWINTGVNVIKLFSFVVDVEAK